VIETERIRKPFGAVAITSSIVGRMGPSPPLERMQKRNLYPGHGDRTGRNRGNSLPPRIAACASTGNLKIGEVWSVRVSASWESRFEPRFQNVEGSWRPVSRVIGPDVPRCPSRQPQSRRLTLWTVETVPANGPGPGNHPCCHDLSCQLPRGLFTTKSPGLHACLFAV